ncbi:MAG TPA: glycosyltransferase [Gemmatimonadaceae bacterium]|nr:glycosyltransferase [Gemmatimonadaceae bacterium]
MTTPDSLGAPRADAGDGGPRPFHVVPPVGAPSARRLLLISQHFPPSHSVGALRWQMLAGYAAERGWGLDVVTLEPEAHVEGVDLARLADLPPDVRIYAVPERQPAVARLVTAAWHAVGRRVVRRGPVAEAPSGAAAPRAATPPRQKASSMAGRSFSRAEIVARPWTKRDAIRAYLAWLEYARTGGWAKAAAGLAERVVRPGVHRAVVSSGPPHMAHEAARAVAERTGLPLVLDFRDPWSLAERLPESISSRLWYRLAERYERAALERAALIVANTEAASRALRARYPSVASRIVTVMNGADEQPMPKRSTADGPFVVAYAGTIYLDRDPLPLFRAAARVVRELALTPAQFAVRFLGDAEGFDVIGAAKEAGIGGFVTLAPPRPRAEALRFLADATLLVSLPQDSAMAVPAKIFEYVQFDAWVLALADRDSATELVLRDSGADVVAARDEDGIAAVLRARYQEFARGVRPAAINRTGRFSRRAQADVLLAALDRIAPPR